MITAAIGIIFVTVLIVTLQDTTALVYGSGSPLCQKPPETRAEWD